MDDSAESAVELYRHVKRSEWGLAILAWERGNKRGFQFQDGALRVISEGYYSLLGPVTERPEGAEQLIADLMHRAGLEAGQSQKSRSGGNLTFADQLQIFRIKYPGGFTDDGWPRGGKGTRLKKHRQPAIDEARSTLSDEALQEAIAAQSCAEIVQALAALLARTNLLKPKELTELRQQPGELAGPHVAALRELLYGDNETPRSQRFDRFVAAHRGNCSWPLATAPGALARPESLVYVHPTTIRRQALVLEPSLSLRLHPNGHAFERVVAMTARIRDLLVEASLPPADLMDVFDFMSITLMPSARRLLEDRSPDEDQD